jgi:hypothetical protein
VSGPAWARPSHAHDEHRHGAAADESEELIDLEEWAKTGKTAMKAKVYRIRIDKEKFDVKVPSMTVGLGPARTGIFNVADMAIMLGAALVVVARYWSDGAQTRSSD